VTRLIHDFRMSRQFLYQVAELLPPRSLRRGARTDIQRTWRFQRRFNRILSGTRDREFQKLRTHLISEMVGTEIGGSEAAARGPGGPGMGQIGDRGLAHGTRAGATEGNRPPREGRGAQGAPHGSGPAATVRAATVPAATAAIAAIAAEIAATAAATARLRPRPPEGPPEIELEKLIGDSLYLDNQAHAIVSRMRDMDSGTKSQLRRLYSAVRRAVRAPESERQHEFVMLRARLAYTIARHGLRSLDQLEKLLLQVTRRNDSRGYERFKDLFEAIVAYNE
jgi:CRISPR type III-A-associated protein Csm2